MVVYKEHTIEDIYTLDELCWSGARDRIMEVEELDDDKQERFIEYLREQLGDEEHLSLMELNDFIWFECDNFIEQLKDEEEEEEE